MPGNHFGWSLSDAVDNPRQTGLVNFRRYKLLEYQNKAGAGVSAGDDEDLATTNQFHRLISEETTATTTRRLMGTDLDSSAAAAIPPPFSRPSVKPYYGRENSVSQCSDSCFGSDYPSLTSTGSPEPPEFPSEANMERGRRWMNLSEAGANQSTGWTERMDEVPRTSSGPPSTTSTSTADVWRGSIHYAKAVMERREGEISSMYDQLHEIEDDLTSMNNQVGKVSSTLQHCNNQVTQQHRRRCNQQQDRDPPNRPPMMSSLYQSQSVSSLNSIQQQPNSSPSFSSFASSSGRNQQQRRSATSNANAAWSCRNLNSLTEDEMADIVHRLLTRICEFTLARQEGRNDIPLIV